MEVHNTLWRFVDSNYDRRLWTYTVIEHLVTYIIIETCTVEYDVAQSTDFIFQDIEIHFITMSYIL